MLVGMDVGEGGFEAGGKKGEEEGGEGVGEEGEE